MKTLASCSPREFLVQTNKIRRAVANWLSLTKIMEIRKHMPDIPDDMPVEEKRAAYAEQARKNINDVLDKILDEYPNETAELLGLMCFVEPDDLDNHKMSEFFGAVNEMLASEEIIDFFISLMRLGNKPISGTAKV